MCSVQVLAAFGNSASSFVSSYMSSGTLFVFDVEITVLNLGNVLMGRIYVFIPEQIRSNTEPHFFVYDNTTVVSKITNSSSFDNILSFELNSDLARCSVLQSEADYNKNHSSFHNNH